MSKFNRDNLLRILAEPLSKRINQKVVEDWSACLWRHLPETNKPRPKDGTRKVSPFVMMFPPPNITGNLHLGHALTGAIQDSLIRHRRMLGDDSIFIPGFDHAGLATQNVVERLLWKQQNITRQQLGRDKFIRLANEWKDMKRSEMRTQLDRLGLDLTYEREYFTMDDRSSLAVHAAFEKLFNSGTIYRSSKSIFWSNQLQTTLSDIEVDHEDGVNRYTRTGEIVSKRLLTQWFIDTRKMAEMAVAVVERDEIEMIPRNYKRTWSSWLLENGVQDWCISRQSWWGHRIPAYKRNSDEDVRENWIVADNLDDAREKLGSEVVQDHDVLDTWFSSSLLPLIIAGWPDLEKFSDSCRRGHFPLQIMETGFDILTYWVSKMAMMSLALTDMIPFKLVLLHGMICDSEGKKMSKSRGNVIDPLDVIDGAPLEKLQNRSRDAYKDGLLDVKELELVLDNQRKLFPQGIPACGADGLRAYLLSHDFQEEVVRVQVQQIEKVRRLSNKIWNVFRLMFMLMDGFDETPLKMSIRQLKVTDLDHLDQQVLRNLAECVMTSHECFGNSYELHKTFAKLEKFITVHLSLNYMVESKANIIDRNIDLKIRRNKLEILAICLITSIKMLHPFMPHLSEFLFQKLMIHNSKCKAIDANYSDLKNLLSREEYPSQNDWKSYLEETLVC